MTASHKTLYEVLGVGRKAKAVEIERAYVRIKADMRKESSAPDPRRAAMAKVAYETLADAERRAEYDDSLGYGDLAGAAAGGRGRWTVWLACALGLLAAMAGAAYYFGGRAFLPDARSGEKSMAPQEILDQVSQHVGRVQGALVSGQVRDLGAAVAVGENEMVATCRGITAGMLLTVRVGTFTAKAELARANEALDICTLTVKGAGEGLKMRSGVPAPQEKLQAVFPADAASGAREVSVARAIAHPAGQAFEIKSAAPLPNGTPIFDAQARLVALVTAPHEFGAEVGTAALGVARIAQARTAAPAIAVASPPALTEPAPDRAARPAPPPPRDSGRATLEEQGFSTLWEEDSSLHLAVTLDNVKHGVVGLPIAFWTRWSGRDSASPHAPRCLVTYGPSREVVADYEQVTVRPEPEGYWYCALTRFQTDLDALPEGEYHFTISVNGRDLAEGSTRLEKRFLTPTLKGALVLFAGLGLLAFLRRNKKVVNYQQVK